MMLFYNVNEDRFSAPTDAECIQKAVDAAADSEIHTVLIPRRNRRNGNDYWTIDRAILLPNDITVVLDDCRLILADGVTDNIFRNARAYESRKPFAEIAQIGIRIIGRGNAVLDGGNDNGVREQNWTSDRPHPRTGNLILLCNVCRYELKGFTCVNMRHWAINQISCRKGHLADISFFNGNRHPNQDGINLRIGCREILIENITGRTGDDVIALTALAGCNDAELLPPDCKPDICHVTIRNVQANTHTTVVALRATDGSVLSDITIENITGLTDPIEDGPCGVVRLGDCNWYKNHPTRLGEMQNITVRNIHSYNLGTVFLEGALSNCHISEIYAGGKAFHAISTYQDERIDEETGCQVVGGVDLENVVIEKVFYSGHKEKAVFCDPSLTELLRREKSVPGCALDFRFMKPENIVKNVVIRDVFAREGCPLIIQKNGPKITVQG